MDNKLFLPRVDINIITKPANMGILYPILIFLKLIIVFN